MCDAAADRLPDAVRDALRAHPEVQAAAANLRATVQTFEQAGAGRYPSIDLRVGGGHQETDSPGTRAAGLGTRGLTRQEANLTLRQNVFDASQVRSQMETQNFRVDSARARLAETGDQVALRVAEAYLDSLRDGQLVVLARDNVTRHQATLDKVRLRFSSGVGQRADVEQAEARLALARSSLVNLQGSQQDSAARYRRVVGRLPLALEPPVSPGNAVPASLDTAQGVAAGNSYSLKAAQTDLSATQATVRSTRADLAPRVDVELSANRNRDIDGISGPNNDASAMLVMRYNLFRGGADQARVKEAMERETGAMEAVRNAQQATEESVARAWHALVAARDRLAYLESHVRAIEQVLGAYQSQFELGRRTLLDVLNTENELFQARSNLATGRAALRLSEYRVLAAMSALVSALGLSDELTKLDAQRPVTESYAR